MEGQNDDIEQLQKICDSLTETELKPAREIFESISAKYPNGFNPLLLRVPKKDDPTGLQYEFQLPRAVIEFMLRLREKYPNEDVASAICGKILGEQII